MVVSEPSTDQSLCVTRIGAEVGVGRTVSPMAGMPVNDVNDMFARFPWVLSVGNTKRTDMFCFGADIFWFQGKGLTGDFHTASLPLEPAKPEAGQQHRNQ